MRVLVTGGCGFVGSHIVDALLGDGHSVAVVDNISTGNMEHFNDKAKLYKVDILDGALRDVFEEFQPEVVYHEAAQIDIQKSIKDVGFDAKINVLGSVRVLECCRDFGVRKIVYASSAAVYGNPDYLPVDEKHPIAPMSFYGVSKFTPELYIKAFAGLYGFQYTILRYANVYGVRQDPKGEGGVVSIFTDKLIKHETPVIFGDGEQTRDFVYVKDVAAANLKALTKGDGEVINVSTGIQTTINQLVDVMSAGAVKAEYRPERPGDIRDSYLDNTKMRTILGHEVEYPLARGVQETMEYYRKKLLVCGG